MYKLELGNLAADTHNIKPDAGVLSARMYLLQLIGEVVLFMKKYLFIKAQLSVSIGVCLLLFCSLFTACDKEEVDLCMAMQYKWQNDWPPHRFLGWGEISPISPNEITALLELDQNSKGALFRINVDNSDTTRLLNDIIIGIPDWHTNGWLVFTKLDWQIYKIKANGDSLIRLTDGDGNFDPSWSPDGKEIAFSSRRGGSVNRIYVMKANGDSVRLASDSPDNMGLAGPKWSPFDELIACHTINHQGDYMPVVLNLNSGEVKTFPSFYPGPGSVSDIDWLDSKTLIVTSRKGIYQLDIETGGTTRLTPDCETVSYVSVSVDYISQRILVHRNVDEASTGQQRTDLVYMNFACKNETLVRLFE